MSHLIRKNRTAGFTLVELLIVIGIIVILLSVVLVAVDPAKRLKQSRDVTRRQDVSDILESIITYEADNNGSIPAGIDSVSGYQVLGTGTTGASCASYATSTSSYLDLSASLVPTYLASMPADPLSGTSANTMYAVDKNSAGRIIVVACAPEMGSAILLQR